MAEKWIANASPLITLGKLGRISLLEELSDEMMIPKGVAFEIAQGASDDPAKRWLESNGEKYVSDIGK